MLLVKLVALTTSLAHNSDAFPSYGTHVPNGDRVPCPEGSEGCLPGDAELNQPASVCFGLGHDTCKGGTLPWNVFGMALQASDITWSTELCEADSDGDGHTNGEELGDPCCEWSRGDLPSPYMKTFTPSHPGLASHKQPDNYKKPECGTTNTAPQAKAIPVGIFNEGEIQKKLTFQVKNYTIPAKETTYADVFFNIDLEETVDIVGGSVIVDQPKHLHHFVVTGCRNQIPEDMVGQPVPEGTMEQFDCWHTLGGFSGWAPGATLFPIPKNAGVTIGKTLGVTSIKINVHYTDGDKPPGPGSKSQDGIIIYATPTLRPMTVRQNTMIGIGSHWNMVVPPKTERYFIARTCTVTSWCQDKPDDMMRRYYEATCTELSAQEGMCSHPEASQLCPVSCKLCDGRDEWPVFGAFHHAHLLGREMYLERERDGVKIDFGSMKNWYFDDQAFINMMNLNHTIRAGDKLHSSCVMNSEERESPTVFGQSSYEEMCFNILQTYQPRESIDAAMPFAFVCSQDEPIWAGVLEKFEDAKSIPDRHPASEAQDIWRGEIGGTAGEWIGEISRKAYEPLADFVVNAYDEDGDGALNTDELNAAMRDRASRAYDQFSQELMDAICGAYRGMNMTDAAMICEKKGLTASMLLDFLLHEEGPAEVHARCASFLKTDLPPGVDEKCCGGPSKSSPDCDVCHDMSSFKPDVDPTGDGWTCQQLQEHMQYAVAGDRDDWQKEALQEIYYTHWKRRNQGKADEEYDDGSIECPTNWIAFRGTCYIKQQRDEHYTDPRTSCEHLGESLGKKVHLPCVHSPEENRLLVALAHGNIGRDSMAKLMQEMPGLPWQSYHWIHGGGEWLPLGIHRIENTAKGAGFIAENWQCGDGKPIDFEAWHEGEPSNHGEGGPGTGWEPDAMLDNGGHWVDASMNHPATYVCQMTEFSSTPAPTPAPTAAPTPEPTPAPPPPTSRPASAPGSPIQTTTFESTLEMEKLESFNTAQYTQAVAYSTSVELSQVEIMNVSYAVQVTCYFGGVVTAAQTKKALLTAIDLEEDKITVTSMRRRLDALHIHESIASTADAFRRLRLDQSTFRRLDQSTFLVSIKVEDPERAETTAMAATTDRFAEYIHSALEKDGVKVKDSKMYNAKKVVQVFTKIQIESLEKVDAPHPTILASSLKEKLGVKVKASVETVSQTTEEQTEEPSAMDIDGSANWAVGFAVWTYLSMTSMFLSM